MKTEDRQLTIYEKWELESEDGMGFSDSLEFRFIAPADNKEMYALQWGCTQAHAEILVNGQNLAEMITRIENKIPEDDQVNMSQSDYGHMDAETLCRYLSGEITDDEGIPVLCCRDCGDEDCDSLRCRIREDGPYVIWDRFKKKSGEAIKKGLSFRFYKEEYEKQLKLLKEASMEVPEDFRLTEWKSSDTDDSLCADATCFSATYRQGALVIGGQDFDREPNPITGDLDYEYFYSFDSENTLKLRNLLTADGSGFQDALRSIIASESPVAALREICEKQGIGYEYFSA